jgi:hypothetical protein
VPDTAESNGVNRSRWGVLAGVLAAFSLGSAACASDPPVDVDRAAVSSALAAAAPWAADVSADCVVSRFDGPDAALDDLVTAPMFARDLDAAYGVSVAVVNCAAPAELTEKYVVSLDLPPNWSTCATSTIQDATVAAVLAARLIGDAARASKALDPFFGCVVRTDLDVTFDIALPGLLATVGLELFAPQAGPPCVQRTLAEASLEPQRTVALLLGESVSPAEVEVFADALVECADAESVAAVLSVTADTSLEPSCVAGDGRLATRAVVVAALAGAPFPAADFDKLVELCG